MIPKQYKAALLLLVVVLGLSACATGPGAGGSMPDAVDARAQARWDALLADDYATAWRYLPPEMRQVQDEETYAASMGNRSVIWTDAKVQGTECADGGEVCTVIVAIFYRVNRGLVGVETMDSVRTIHERWVRVDDAWYFIADRL